MKEELSRTEMLVGSLGIENLKAARVAVFGIGGVGGYVAETLARSGVGALDLIDSDTVNLSNINRQIIALHSTVGQYKVDVMKARIADINPNCRVEVYKCFFLPENQHLFDFTKYSYVVDAVDTVTAKIQLVLQAEAAGVPIISCMGAGNKLDPTAFEVADIYKTSVCPLAKVMRRELKQRGVKKLKVVYSREEARKPLDGVAQGNLQSRTEEYTAGITPQKRSTPGSTAFVPSVAGLIIASEVVKDIAGLQ